MAASLARGKSLARSRPTRGFVLGIAYREAGAQFQLISAEVLPYLSLRVQAASAASKSWIDFPMRSSVKFPAASNFCAAPPIITSGLFNGCISRNTKHCRKWYCARADPNGLTEAPITATGFPCQQLSPYGREPQSIAFFNTPGME